MDTLYYSMNGNNIGGYSMNGNNIGGYSMNGNNIGGSSMALVFVSSSYFGQQQSYNSLYKLIAD